MESFKNKIKSQYQHSVFVYICDVYTCTSKVQIVMLYGPQPIQNVRVRVMRLNSHPRWCCSMTAVIFINTVDKQYTGNLFVLCMVSCIGMHAARAKTPALHTACSCMPTAMHNMHFYSSYCRIPIWNLLSW